MLFVVIFPPSTPPSFMGVAIGWVGETGEDTNVVTLDALSDAESHVLVLISG